MASANTSQVSEEVRYLLAKYRISARQQAGQHFLIDEDVFKSILEEAKLGPRGNVLEVGAGIGTLTARLAVAAGRVLAIEIDPQFKPILDRLAEANPSLAVYFGDFLQMPFDVIQNAFALTKKKTYSVVANIPYYITARLIRRVMTFPLLPKHVLILIQREVAERIVAATGHHSKLSLAVHFYGKPEIICTVPSSSFYPKPEVESALLSITKIAPWRHAVPEQFVWQLVTFGFAAKRKKLCSNVASGLRVEKKAVEEALIAIGVPPEARAEHLSPHDWVALGKILQNVKG